MVFRRRFSAKLESLPDVRDFVLVAASRTGFPDARQMVLELVLEELFVNIVSYAFVCPVRGPAAGAAGHAMPVIAPVEYTPEDAHLDVLCGAGKDAPEMHGPLGHAITDSGHKPEELFCVVLEDEGIAFDPLAADTPSHLDHDVERRQCGGLGIHFAKERSAAMAYERIRSANRLGFCIHH
ncbi:MAG: ATP-binding protein [Oceanidesulfovibrio sp.]